MVNQVLIGLVDKVLGTGKPTARNNRAYNCPFCNHHKPKLEVNFSPNEKNEYPYNCWVCGKKGRSLVSLFRKVNASQNQLEELGLILKVRVSSDPNSTKIEKIELPKEFKPLTQVSSGDIIGRHAINYLKRRGLGKHDIYKYNIGYCEQGKYAKMIIIPSYNEKGDLNYFVARNFDQNSPVKYKNPPTSKDVIPFELFVNWNLPITICEGPFDAIAIKRNVVPLFGKIIPNQLMKKLVTSQVDKIYIALDKDAQKQALTFCQQLLDLGKEVYMVDMEDKDPSEMGFENFTKLIQNTLPTDYYDLMQRKLQAI
jgi:DNA primase